MAQVYGKEGRSFADLTHNYKASYQGVKALTEHEVYQRRCEAFPRRECILGIRWYLHAFFGKRAGGHILAICGSRAEVPIVELVSSLNDRSSPNTLAVSTSYGCPFHRASTVINGGRKQAF